MLIRQEDRRLAEGPREPVVALLHHTGIELATRIRLFPPVRALASPCCDVAPMRSGKPSLNSSW